MRFINTKRLTHWLSVPSLISFAKRLRALAPDSMPTLRLSSFGGEPLTIKQVNDWTAAAPNTAVINCYGPTQTTVIDTRVRGARRPIRPGSSRRTRSVPIGDIYPHLDYVLLDAELPPVRRGDCVSGASSASPATSIRLRTRDGSSPLTATGVASTTAPGR
ncbi:AMP-binding protein [Salinispora arenicola]|uniref:AMP-binding protein n=1 Tax=Salinispora arenicola TaxID=168697 RepID=UPI003CC783CC